jgi:hypothetical protein
VSNHAAGAGPTRPVTVGQEALWLVNRLDPGGAAYNLVLAVRVCTPVDVTVLRRALTAVVERHDVLRSVFVEEAGACRRRVLAPEAVELECLDAPDGVSLEDFVHRVTTEPFVLAERVLRALLIRAGGDGGDSGRGDGRQDGSADGRGEERLLVLAAHHIAVDGYSMGVVLRDLLEAYAAYADGGAPTWPALGYDWDAHVAREQAALSPAEVVGLEEHWRRECAGVPAVLDLPRTRRAAAHATAESTVPAETAAELPAAAGRLGVSAFALMVAAYQALLHRYTGQEDFLIAVPVHTRVGTTMRGAAGYFANPIPVRARLTEATTLAEAAREAHRRLAEGQAHAAYPFARLPRLLGVRPEPGRPVLAQAGISFVARIKRGSLSDLLAAGAACGMEIDFHGLRLRAFDVRQQEGQFDLMLELKRGADTLRGSLRHSVAVFSPREAERFTTRYARMLRSACERPDTRIADLELDDAASHEHLLALGAGGGHGAGLAKAAR